MPKRILAGTVTGDQNAQTVSVSVQRSFQHPVSHSRMRTDFEDETLDSHY